MIRRILHFENTDDVVAECEKLAKSTYVRNGNWSLGQICCHIRLTMDANMDGYPWWMSLAMPLRPILRSLLLPRLLRGDSPAGIKTAGIFVPSTSSTDGTEVQALAACVNRFRSHSGLLYPHPGFGRLTKNEFDRFHAAHAAHHLGFLAHSDSEIAKTDHA